MWQSSFTTNCGLFHHDKHRSVKLNHLIVDKVIYQTSTIHELEGKTTSVALDMKLLKMEPNCSPDTRRSSGAEESCRHIYIYIYISYIITLSGQPRHIPSNQMLPSDIPSNHAYWFCGAVSIQRYHFVRMGIPIIQKRITTVLSTHVLWKGKWTCLLQCVIVYMFIQIHIPKLENYYKRVCLWMHVLLVCLRGLWSLGEGAAYLQSAGFPRSQITAVLIAASLRRTAPQ